MDRMSTSDLLLYLEEELNMSIEDTKEMEGEHVILNKAHQTSPLFLHLERNIDGQSFTQLTRQDLALIYPSKEKFLLASKLFKLAQQVRLNSQASGVDTRDTLSLLADMSELESSSSTFSTPGSSRCSTPSGRKHSLTGQSSVPKKKCTTEVNATSFKLPHFSPDVRSCISNDSFYTSAHRNKLIKEGCMALRGHCWEEEKSVTSYDKRNLAKSLCELAPKSLSDASGSTPEVSRILYRGGICSLSGSL